MDAISAKFCRRWWAWSNFVRKWSRIRNVTLSKNFFVLLRSSNCTTVMKIPWLHQTHRIKKMLTHKLEFLSSCNIEHKFFIHIMTQKYDPRPRRANLTFVLTTSSGVHELKFCIFGRFQEKLWYRNRNTSFPTEICWSNVVKYPCFAL